MFKHNMKDLGKVNNVRLLQMGRQRDFFVSTNIRSTMQIRKRMIKNYNLCQTAKTNYIFVYLLNLRWVIK